MEELSKEELSKVVIDFVESLGVCEAGIATVETLQGGPPTAELNYVLPEAKSAICFAVPFNQHFIPPFLSKHDRLSHEKDILSVNSLASGIALKLAAFLNQNGHPSVQV